ncbi:hypothetical protein VO178_09490 [Lysinibacillus fusiformis]|nr:hypothetical protein [Lysinibacillus fusiformis]WRS99907.1 hypothetical protein VO178_09490 [Lysinibacillus fusiformis]
MPMMKQLKRKAVIEQLQKFGINDIEGQPLEDVLYSLLKTLKRKRPELD